MEDAFADYVDLSYATTKKSMYPFDCTDQPSTSRSTIYVDNPPPTQASVLTPDIWAKMLMGSTLISGNKSMVVAIKERIIPGATIDGIPTSSPIVRQNLFTSENWGSNASTRALNLGTMVLAESEKDKFLQALPRPSTFKVTVTQTTWTSHLGTLYSVLIQAVEPPLDFARTIAAAWNASIQQTPNRMF